MVDYKEKISTLLNNDNTYMYTKITDKCRNPTSWVEKDRNKLLSGIKSCPSNHDQGIDQMDAKLYNRLHSTDATPSTFYGLHKIHKADISLCRITSCINSPTYNLLKHLVSVLSPTKGEILCKKHHWVCPGYRQTMHGSHGVVRCCFSVDVHPSRAGLTCVCCKMRDYSKMIL